MLIASWNVNSINVRLEHLKSFVHDKHPDIILLQETKSIDAKFPLSEIEDLGYNVQILGQKSYNGVAILSKYRMEDVVTVLPTLSSKWPAEARYIEASVAYNDVYLRVISVYVPNGSEVGSEKFAYKLDFLHSLKSHMSHLKTIYGNILVGGDLNVAPEEIDVYNPKALNGSIGFHIDERNALRSILNQGWLDTFRLHNPTSQEFSWWDYRRGGFAQNRGMRIDHILASPQASDLISSAEIYKATRVWERPSDHVPVLCKIGS